MDILNTASVVLELTHAKRIQWEHEDGTPCFTTVLNGNKIIICKSSVEGGKKSILFNQIDDNYEIIGSINRWEEGDNNFEKVNSLYAIIEKSVCIAA